MTKEKIQVKDLITVGIFTAIMFVVCMCVAMLGYVPIFIPLLSVIVPIIGGIPYMLFLTKTKKFGMITIMGVLEGIIMGIMGMGIWAFLTGPLFGFIADLVVSAGKFKSVKHDILGYGIYSMWLIGNYLPIVLSREAYIENLTSSGYGGEYTEALMRYIPDWSLIPLLIACFVSGLIGGFVGRVILKKHFKRAGIA